MANSALTFLQRAGKAILKGLGVAVKVAAAAEPFVDLAAPEVAVAYNTAVALATAQEAAFVGSGTGAQKRANLVAALTKWASDNGYTATSTEIEKWGSAVADSLNAFPFVKAAAASSSAPVNTAAA